MAGRDNSGNQSGNTRNQGRRQGKPQGQNSGKALTGEQRKALQKIRNVIPKEKASDEELLTMLVEHEMSSDKVVQQYYEVAESGENDWAVSTNRRDARKKKLESQEHKQPREHREQRPAHQNTAPRGQPREQLPQALPTPMGEPAINASLNQDSIQFGGYNTQDMTQPQTMFMPPEGLLPPPTGMPPFPMANLADPLQQQSNAPLQPGPQDPETKIADLPESDVNSQTHVHGDVLHSSTMSKNLWTSLVSLWDKRHLVDLKLKPQPGTKRISVHAVVVAAASPTVADALMSTKKDRDDDRNPPELLVHCDCQALEECVRFCYTGELRVSDDALANLWYAGSVLEMREVLDLCINWAQNNIHAGNAHTINALADQYHVPDLKAAVDRYVLTNMQKLVLENDFVRQPLERIIELLSSDDAKFDGELEVFYAVVRWIEHDKAGRAQYLSQLMNTAVRLPQLDFDELEKIEVTDLVANDATAMKMMHNVYRYLAAPTQRRLAMDIPGSRPRNSMLQ